MKKIITVQHTQSDLLREFDLGEAVGKTKKWARENIACFVWQGALDWAKSKDGRVFHGAESRAAACRLCARMMTETAPYQG